MALAYGTVQRRATLDHVAGRLLEPAAGEARPAGARRAAPRAVPAAVPRTASPTTPPSRERRAGQAIAAAAAPGSSTPCCGAPPARAARSLGGARRPRPRRRRRSCTRCPSGWRELWWDELGAERRARAAGARSTSPRSPRCASTRWSPRSTRCAPRLPRRRHGRRPGSPRGWCSQAPFDAQGSEPWSAGAIMPQSRALDAGRARARAPAAGERVLDLCAAPGGKTTHLAALIADAGEVVAVERHPGRADALRATCRADARRLRPGPARRRGRAPRPRAALTACSSTRRAAGWARCSRAPTCAGARRPRRSTSSPGSSGGSSPRRAAATRPGGHAGLLGVHDLAPRRAAAGRRFLREHPDFEAADLAGELPHGRRGDPRDLQLLPRPRRHRRILHRPARDAAEAAAVTLSGDRDRRPSTSSVPTCPGCGEPWLRPTAVPGPLPLRVLPAALRARLGVPELRRALDDRADVEHRDRRVQPLPGQHAAGGLARDRWRRRARRPVR